MLAQTLRVISYEETLSETSACRFPQRHDNNNFRVTAGAYLCGCVHRGATAEGSPPTELSGDIPSEPSVHPGSSWVTEMTPPREVRLYRVKCQHCYTVICSVLFKVRLSSTRGRLITKMIQTFWIIWKVRLQQSE